MPLEHKSYCKSIVTYIIVIDMAEEYQRYINMQLTFIEQD